MDNSVAFITVMMLCNFTSVSFQGQAGHSPPKAETHTHCPVTPLPPDGKSVLSACQLWQRSGTKLLHFCGASTQKQNCQSYDESMFNSPETAKWSQLLTSNVQVPFSMHLTNTYLPRFWLLFSCRGGEVVVWR